MMLQTIRLLGEPTPLFFCPYRQSKPPTRPHNRVHMPILAVSMRDGRFQGPCLNYGVAAMIGTPLATTTHLASIGWLPAPVPQLKLLEGPMLWAPG